MGKAPVLAARRDRAGAVERVPRRLDAAAAAVRFFPASAGAVQAAAGVHRVGDVRRIRHL